MSGLLLDENISDEIERQVAAKRPDIPVFSAHDWEKGWLRDVSDEGALRAAAEAGLTLVSYDVSTIPLPLVRLANEPFVHGGAVFVNNAAIRSNDFGSLVRAFMQFYDAEKESDWENRLFFLPSPR